MVGIFSFWRDRKARKAREQMLKNTPHMERIWLLRHVEFVAYCDNNNAYVFCIARAVDLRLNRNKNKFDEERQAFNEAVAERFTRMVSHSSNQVRIPFRAGNNPSQMKPHPLERSRINTRVHNALQAMDEILKPECSLVIAKALAEQYIIDPYQVKENPDVIAENN